MILGLPRETKEGEQRVVLLPEAVAELARAGHEVVVEARAGAAIGHDDAAYARAGARIVDAAAAWGAELVVKVKEAQDADLPRIPRGATIFSFHHLPGEPRRTRALAALEATAIAFEMVRDASGGYPLLAPMSEIAGRQAVEVAAAWLGAGLAQVLVLGAGHAGLAAAREAAARGARVTVITRSARSRAAARAQGFAAEVATAAGIEGHALAADLVVGAVFVAGEPTPKLLPRSLVARMKRGAMIVDVSIDAGGVAETSRPTTHGSPTYIDEGVVHYCVPNMPAAVPREGAAAISAAVLPYARELAARGVARAVRENPALRCGVLLWKGCVAHRGIAEEAGLPYVPLADPVLA